MAREADQNKVMGLLEQVTSGSIQRKACPEWLKRPGEAECGSLWPLVSDVYKRLAGGELPSRMPEKEWRSLDAIWTDDQGRQRVVEYDEGQHFNRYRETTFRSYPAEAPLAFDLSVWVSRCRNHEDIRGGNFSAPRPPLFPMEKGRNYQRAFRDMLADLLPPMYGWLPTLRIGHFEVESWLDDRDGSLRMKELLDSKTQAE